MTTAKNWDYRRALQELWRRSSYERGLISDPFGTVETAEAGLRRMRTLLAAMNNPQMRVPAVHIAGSKGKGSTGAMIAAAARQAGHRVGFYSSPHLHRFPERILVDGSALSDDAFAAETEAAARAAARLEGGESEPTQVTTFELITAMAFAAFARRTCDLAVIEVGLGGRYDATNVLQPAVSVITRIDLEHTAVLGSTYAAIAEQKAGILRTGVPCVASPQVEAAAETITHVAREIGAPLLMGGRDWTWQGSWRHFDATGPWGHWRDIEVGIPGPHQVENACTALAAIAMVTAAGIDIPDGAARSGLRTVSWPGRFERLRDGAHSVIFDGAHTPAAAEALVATWREAHLAEPATVIFGMGGDKNIDAVLAGLRPLIGRLIATAANSPRSADPAAIAAIARELAIPVSVHPSVADAVADARASGAGPILITGSLFVVGEAREAFGLAEPDREWQALNDAHRSGNETPDRA